MTQRPAKRTYSIFEGTSFDKYACCKLDIKTIFSQKHKASFTRKKNILTRQLLNYERKLKRDVLKVVYDVLNTVDDKRSHNRQIANRLNLNISSVYKMRDRLNI